MTVGRILTGAALITNPTGLHARPAVKLTKLAKSFEAQLRLRVGQHGKWTDAKSVARVLSLKPDLKPFEIKTILYWMFRAGAKEPDQ